jgi:hypothetical protein
MDTETLFMKKIGFQPRSWTLRMVCTASGGRIAAISAWQPLALSSTICRSTDPSVN